MELHELRKFRRVRSPAYYLKHLSRAIKENPFKQPLLPPIRGARVSFQSQSYTNQPSNHRFTAIQDIRSSGIRYNSIPFQLHGIHVNWEKHSFNSDLINLIINMTRTSNTYKTWRRRRKKTVESLVCTLKTDVTVVIRMRWGVVTWIMKIFIFFS